MLKLFSDKITEILDKHNVVVNDHDNLKNDLVETFLETQILDGLNKKKAKKIPQSLLDILVDGFPELDEAKLKEIIQQTIDWAFKTEEGNRWLANIFSISSDLLTKGVAIQYYRKDGSKINLNPERTIVYYKKDENTSE